jgi:hypothetical protein
MTLGDHNHSSKLELDNLSHLSSSNINLDGIVGLNIRVGVTDGASVVGDGNRDLSGGDVSLHNLAKLERSLVLGNTLKDESSLDIEEKTEEISRFLKLDDILESSREVVVGTDLSVYLDTSFHTDLHALLSSEGILKTITEDDGEGKTLTHLVRSSRRLGSPYSGHLSEVPMPRGIDTLKVLSRSTSPVDTKRRIKKGMRE